MDKLQSILDKLRTQVIDGIAFVTSTSVAEAFEVKHDNMLKSIRGIIKDNTSFNLVSRNDIVQASSLISRVQIPTPINLRSREEITDVPTNIESNNITGSIIVESFYTDSRNRKYPEFLLNKYAFFEVAINYTKDSANAKIVSRAILKRLEELEVGKDSLLCIIDKQNLIILELSEKVSKLDRELKVITNNNNYFKVRDYFSAQGVKLTVDECKSIGFKATKYCNHKAIPIKPEFTSLGKTNTYPSNVLQMLHKQYVISNYGTLGLFN